MKPNLKLNNNLNNRKNKAIDMDQILFMIDEIIEDKSVPKNVRARMEEIKSNLSDSNQENIIKIGTSITIMDDVSNDPNLPTYARTKIWNIVSAMESFRMNAR